MTEHLHSRRSGAVAALILIAIGVFLLLAQNGIVSFEDVWRFWPSIFVLAGILKLVQGGPAGTFVGVLLMGAGALIQLSLLGLIPFQPQELWPLGLIFAGLWLLWRNFQPRRYDQAQFAKWRCGRRFNPGVDHWTIFGGGERRVSEQDFEGTEILAIFGGLKMDLRKTGLKDGRAVIDANAVFGGVEILVPESWNVVMRGVGIFGGYGDETHHPNGAGPVPELVVQGVALFGGVVIKN